MPVVMYSCISEHSELTSQRLCTHVYQSSQNLQVSSYVLTYLRAVRTYKSVVMYSCISEHSDPHTNLTTSIDGLKADLEENKATVRITNRHEMFCEEHYSTY